MNLTPDTLRAMIETAERATPGPWVVGDRRANVRGFCQERDIGTGPEPSLGYSSWDGMCTTFGSNEDPQTGETVCEANAAHIAACSPEVIIALCRIALAAHGYVDAYGRKAHLWKPYEAMRDALREAFDDH